MDIRHYGSGNAGATNTYRVFGFKFGPFVIIADLLKGVIPTLLYLFIPYNMHNELEWTNFMSGLGLGVVVAHVFPIFADFKGGKGVATLLGMVIGTKPVVAICCVAVFFFVLFFTRFVSLSSILAGVGFAVFTLFIWYKK